MQINYTDMQIMHFILDKILKLLTYYMPFCHQSLQSYLISNTVEFLGHPVHVKYINSCAKCDISIMIMHHFLEIFQEYFMTDCFAVVSNHTQHT